MIIIIILIKMEDASIEDKQKFLCETILDKVYDSNKFVQFLFAVQSIILIFVALKQLFNQ